MSKQTHHTSKAPSQRQLRVGEMLRRTLSSILQRGDVHDPELNAMFMTVGEVRCSPDLKKATAFVLPLGGGDHEAALVALRRNKPALRKLLAKESQLKYTPDLSFRIDESFDQYDATRKLLSEDRVKQDLEK